MKNLPITITLPEDIIKDLHLYISKRKISQFIAKVVVKGLETEKQKFAGEFKEAAQDIERNTDIEIWDTLSGEGLNKTNPYKKG